MQRMLQTDAEELEAELTGTATRRFGHDFSGIPIHASAAKARQTKLVINRPGDSYEQEADRVSEQVTRTSGPQLQRTCACGGGCPKCQTEQPAHGQGLLQTKHVGSSGHARAAAPAIVQEALASPGQPLDAATRRFMEPRLGHDFSRVRVHDDDAARQSARAVNAHAYTVGHDIIFAAGRFAPGTQEGQRLLAHELTHVVQQSGAEGVRAGQSSEEYGSSHETPLSANGGGVMQRQPADVTEADEEKRECQTETDCQRLVREGKWCRDTEKSGRLHPGKQCYRQIPPPEGYHSAKQYCFDKKTGQYAESSPDFVSVVNGQNEDGTCDIGYVPHPFTQRGRRTAGHLIADVATEDPHLTGGGFGGVAGLAMGIALPKEGLDPVLGNVLIPTILGSVGALIGSQGLPLLNRVARKRGFLPTLSLGVGSNIGLGVGVGLEKRDRPLPLVPINTYPTLSFDTSLALGGGSAPSNTFLVKVGVRLDPGKQGGVFALASVGAGLEVGKGITGARSTELGVGLRATDFLDVQVVRESVSGEESRDATYWLTLKLSAPQSVLKGHPK